MDPRPMDISPYSAPGHPLHALRRPQARLHVPRPLRPAGRAALPLPPPRRAHLPGPNMARSAHHGVGHPPDDPEPARAPPPAQGGHLGQRGHQPRLSRALGGVHAGLRHVQVLLHRPARLRKAGLPLPRALHHPLPAPGPPDSPRPDPLRHALHLPLALHPRLSPPQGLQTAVGDGVAPWID